MTDQAFIKLLFILVHCNFIVRNRSSIAFVTLGAITCIVPIFHSKLLTTNSLVCIVIIFRSAMGWITHLQIIMVSNLSYLLTDEIPQHALTIHSRPSLAVITGNA